MSNGLIFIQIAAYRDAELLPTLRDCVAQASDARRLRFGICWQRSDEGTLGEFAQDARVRVFETACRAISRRMLGTAADTVDVLRGSVYLATGFASPLCTRMG